MVHTSYYRSVAKKGGKAAMQEEMNYLLLEIEEDQRTLKVLCRSLDEIKRKRLSGEKLKKKDLDIMFDINDELKGLITVTDSKPKKHTKKLRRRLCQ